MALLLLRAPRPRQTGLWPNEPSRLGAGPARGAEGAAHAEPPLLGLAGNHLITLARSRGLFRARTPAAGPSQGFCGPPVLASPKETPPLAEERAPGKPTRLRRVLGAGVDSSTAQCVPRGLRRGLRGPSEPRQRQSAVRSGRTGGQRPLKLSAKAEAGGGADGVPRAAPRRGPRSPGGPAAWRVHRVCWDVS